MIQRRSFIRFASADHGRLGNFWDAKGVRGMVTTLVIALQGLLVTGTVVATIAYLLLVNSHI
jgi:hypothetical protein